jgi:tetratricopeptide (TPR) repeat protein
MSSENIFLSEPNVNYAGVARWPLKLSVNPFKWMMLRMILTAIWGVAFVASAGFGFVHPSGTGVAALLVLAVLYYWYRVWQSICYSCLLPAVVVSKTPFQIASYANLSQTRKFLPAIKIAEAKLSSGVQAECDVGTRVVCIGSFDPPIVGFKWVNFHPVPLENLIANRNLIKASADRLPEHLWEALEIGLGSIEKPERGLYEIPVDPFAASAAYDNTEVDEATATTVVQTRATKKNLVVYYSIVGCILITIAGLSVYSRLNPYGSAVQSGDAAFNSGNFAGAAEHYQKAIKLDPKQPLAYFHRAVVYQKSGDHLKAQMDFNDLLRLRPDFGPGYRMRAATLRALRLDDAAEKDNAIADKLGSDKTIANPFMIKIDQEK